MRMYYILSYSSSCKLLYIIWRAFCQPKSRIRPTSLLLLSYIRNTIKIKHAVQLGNRLWLQNSGPISSNF